MVDRDRDRDGKPSVVVALNDRARTWGLRAGALVKVAATALGGSGGGKDDVARAAAPTRRPHRRRSPGVERAIAQRVTSG